MQWNQEYGTHGRLIEERDVPIMSSPRPKEISPPGTADTLLGASNHTKGLCRFSPKLDLLGKLIGKSRVQKQKPDMEQRRHSWIPDALVFETTALFRDKRTSPEPDTVPLPEGCQVPNAVFARKYLLLDTSDSLPPSLSLRQMPTAEAKATDAIVEAATNGLLNETSQWSFRGPFTPQLGFDGGLDYQWTSQESVKTFRRFDLDQDAPSHDLVDPHSSQPDPHGLKIANSTVTHQRTSTKRQGIIFSIDTAIDLDKTTPAQDNYTTSPTHTAHSTKDGRPRVFDEVSDLDLVASGGVEMPYKERFI